MHDELLAYYQRELTQLRQLGRRFAQDYPIIAGRLQLTGDASPDPNVERLIESFALVAARIHHRIDDSLPEISEALVGSLYPHLSRPVPARTIIQIEASVDHQASGRDAYVVPRGAMLETPHLRTGGGQRSGEPAEPLACRFRTVYPVELWPVEVVDVRYERVDRSALRRTRTRGRSVLRVRLACRGDVSFSQLPLDRLRFHLDGEPGTVHALYELMRTALVETIVGAVDAADPEMDAAGFAPAPSIRVAPVGFEAGEGVLDYDPRSHIAYRLLHEYFTFPEKFLFLDVTGLRAALASSGRCIDLCFVFARDSAAVDEDLSIEVGAQSLKLGCTPVVNLFGLAAEPIRVTHEVDGHAVVADIRRPAAYEIYSVDRVTLVSRAGEVLRRPLPPLLGEHTVPASEQAGLSWFTSRVPSPDGGADLRLHLVDRTMEPAMPTDAVLGVSVTATNRDLAMRMPVNQPNGDLVLVDASPMVARIRCLRKPRRPIRPSFGGDRLWGLVSHLSLNRLSLANADALRGLLDLYNLADRRKDPHLHDQMRQQIAGIASLEAESVVERFGPLGRSCFVQGTGIEMTVDEDHFVGGGAYVFGSILERFFGLHAAANSFVRLRLHSLQRKGVLATWPPRAGDAILI